jgi:maleate cis-trans isomerase
MSFFPTARIGLLAPSANPAFEPELQALLPADVAVHATRLPVMSGTTLEERNARYIATYRDAIASFGALALDALAVGLTGPSYALPPAEDAALAAEFSRAAGRPVVLPSQAIGGALQALGLRRLRLFSAYPGWLTDRAEKYWRAAGFEIIETFKVSDTFRAYELEPPEIIAALQRMTSAAGEAVLLSGTGMATLDAMVACQSTMPAVLLSSNVAVAFTLLRLLRRPPTEALRMVSPALAQIF